MLNRHYAIFAVLLAWGLLAVATSCSADLAEIGLEQGQSGSITRFAIHNGFMYALNPNEVKTYSLANPDKPEHLHTLVTDYGLETIIVYEGSIFIGSRSALYILDISNPAAPFVRSQSNRADDLLGGCDPVVVQGNFAYSTVKIIINVCGQAAAQSALLVYDVSNLSNPVNVGTYFMNRPNGLGYKGDHLFVCDEGSGLVEVFDISNPLDVKPTPFAIPIADAIDLIIRGDQMIVSARTEFRFYDISNIEDIKPLGSIGK